MTSAHRDIIIYDVNDMKNTPLDTPKTVVLGGELFNIS